MRFLPLIAVAVVAFAHTASAAPNAPLRDATKPDRSATGLANAELAKNEGFKELTGEDRDKEAARVETYLSNITTMTANFAQRSTDGSKGAGIFQLKRPGKMRWQYNPPTPIQLVSDGKVVVYYDPGLDQVTYIGIDDTLAGFLTKQEIKLDSATAKLTKLEKRDADGALRVTLIQAKKPTEGSLTMELSDKPLEIRRMVTKDATGNTTMVDLTDAKFGEPLEDKLFTFKDPRGVNAKRNKRGN